MKELAIITSGYRLGHADNLVLTDWRVTRTITPDTEVAIVGTKPIAFDDVKHLKGIVRLGVGYENLPLDECRKAGIVLAYTPNAPSQAVAEHALALMLSALRLNRTRERPGKMLSEISVAIIGRGRIGKRLAAMLSALHVDLMAVDPVRDTTFDMIHKIDRCDLDTALASADVVSLHVPVSDETTNMIDLEALTAMNDDAVLVNTSRGPVVNEAELACHLEEEPNFTAALDVFTVEPYDGPLLRRKNCICTPHVAAMTIPARAAMEYHALNAAMSIARGERPEWVIPEKEPWQ